MDAQPVIAPTGTPSWRRVCLHSVLILGIFAMHHLLVGHAAGHPVTTDHAMVMSAAAPTHHDGAAPVVDDGGHGAMPSMADCCGLLMACLSIVAGLGALLLVRRGRTDRVLWQRPPATRLGEALRAPPLAYRALRQRSPILRC